MNYLNDTKLSPGEYENIWQATIHNDLNAVKFWIRERPEQLNELHNQSTFTALHYSIIHKNYNVLYHLIIKAKADINKPSGHTNTTPLHEAVKIDDQHAVEYLISHDALIDLVDFNSESPLHYAAKNGFFNIAKYLIDHKASPHLRNKFNQIPADLIPNSCKDKFTFM